MNPKALCENLFSLAGVRVNGSQPFDIQIHDERFFKRFLKDGRLGLGESYVDGWWDSEDIDEFTYRLIQSEVLFRKHMARPGEFLTYLSTKFLPYGSEFRSHNIGKAHYDLDNELFSQMLDKRMIYSCAYWSSTAQTLDDAQEAKLDLICRKLKLSPGLTVLDVGSGWGGLAKFAAENYQVKVTGITVSKEQLILAREKCKGLPVSFELLDYRQISGKFDRIVSVGMLEHVGRQYYPTFMIKMRSCLKEDGIFLLHTIGSNHSQFSNPWLVKYIFPGGYIPSLKQIGEALERRFVVEDLHNIGPHYYQTLRAWYDNFEMNWKHLQARYDERFFRIWKYYLLATAPGFKARYGQVWQFILSPNGIPGGYSREESIQTSDQMTEMRPHRELISAPGF